MFLNHIGELITEDFDKVNALVVKSDNTCDGRRFYIEAINGKDLQTLVKGDVEFVTDFLLVEIRDKSSVVNVTTNNYNLPITCNKASNIIGSATRRGCGNTILAPFDVVCDLDNSILKPMYTMISNTLLKDEIIIHYINKRKTNSSLCDTGLIIRQLDNGEYEVKALNNWLDYYQHIKIENV